MSRPIRLIATYAASLALVILAANPILATADSHWRENPNRCDAYLAKTRPPEHRAQEDFVLEISEVKKDAPLDFDLSGIDINGVDSNGRTALVQSLMLGNETAVEFLLSHGASVHAPTCDGILPIHLVKNMHPRLLVRLINEGAELNHVANMWGDQRTPLMALVSGSYFATGASDEELRYILEHGADPNVTTPDGTSAASIILSEEQSFSRVACILLEYGMKDVANGSTSISKLCEVAKQEGYYTPELRDVNRRLKDAIYLEDKNQVKVLLEQGADPNFQGESVDSFVVAAAELETSEILELLITYGGSAKKLSPASSSPLFAAIHKTGGVNPETVALLLRHGADPNETDPYGENTYTYIRAYLSMYPESKGNQEVLQMLEQYGAGDWYTKLHLPNKVVGAIENYKGWAIFLSPVLIPLCIAIVLVLHLANTSNGLRYCTLIHAALMVPGGLLFLFEIIQWSVGLEGRFHLFVGIPLTIGFGLVVPVGFFWNKFSGEEKWRYFIRYCLLAALFFAEFWILKSLPVPVMC